MPRNFRLGYNSDETGRCRCMHVAPTPAVLTARGEKNIQLARPAAVHTSACPHGTLWSSTVKWPAMARDQAKREARKRQREMARARVIRRVVI